MLAHLMDMLFGHQHARRTGTGACQARRFRFGVSELTEERSGCSVALTLRRAFTSHFWQVSHLSLIATQEPVNAHPETVF